MKSKWGKPTFGGLIERLNTISDLWKQAIELEIEETRKKVKNIEKVGESLELAQYVSENRDSLKSRIIEDDLD